MKLSFCLALSLSFVITAVTLRFLIPYLKSRKLGQKILEIGPRWHKSKEGTPTMGGLSFLLAFLLVVPTVLFSVSRGGARDENLVLVFITVVFALLNGGIGILDDRTKFSKGQNEGLLSWQKYLLQLGVTVLYLAAMTHFGGISTDVTVPFLGISFSLPPVIYYPLAALLITGVINSVNLADGIDGLAASETAVVALFFSAVAFTFGSYSLGTLAAATLGGCLGFLVYNFYPARVFMGGTGSLFLGALVIGMTYLMPTPTAHPLIVVVVGLMYLVETASVILQVGYFKLTHGKRLFKMSPIHHHFEKSGWSEIKIVTVFSLLTLILSVLAYLFDILPHIH